MIENAFRMCASIGLGGTPQRKVAPVWRIVGTEQAIAPPLVVGVVCERSIDVSIPDG
jgi:hypothetical protein